MIKNYAHDWMTALCNGQAAEPTKPTPQGYQHGDHLVMFIDVMGKDISFPRWRVNLYYASNLAETVFFNSEKEYVDYIDEFKSYVYQNYTDYRAANDERGD